MRYTTEQEQKARGFGNKVLEHHDKRHAGFVLVPMEYRRGADYGVDITLLDSAGEFHSQHRVLLYRAERIYVCDCQAQEFANACKHVGMALIDHDIERSEAETAAQAAVALEVEQQPQSREGHALDTGIPADFQPEPEPILYRNSQPFSIYKSEMSETF